MRTWLGPFKAVFKVLLVFYLVSHGVSLPAGGQAAGLGDLAVSFWYAGLDWFRAPASWISAVAAFLGRRCPPAPF